MAAEVGRKRRVPEVVVFSEPSFSTDRAKPDSTKVRSKNSFLRGGDGSEFLNHDPSPEEQILINKRKEEEEKDDELFVTIDMQSAMRDAKLLCGEGLTGRKKRRFEEQRAKELGGKGHKPDVVPYPAYMKMQQQKREKGREIMEDLKAQGMPVTKKSKTAKEFKGKGRWSDNLTDLDPYKTVGKVKDGVLNLNQKYKSKSKPLPFNNTSNRGGKGPQKSFRGRQVKSMPSRTSKGRR